MAEWFGDWSEAHMVRFGIQINDERAALVSDWEESFDGRGITLAEADAASRWLSENAPPKYLSDHRAALLGRIRAIRAEDASRLDPAPDRGSCVTCGDCGEASVPHPRYLDGGGWAELSVWCGCAVGRARRERFEASDWWRKLKEWHPHTERLTLESYQARYPDWREHVARRKCEQAERTASGK